MESKEELKQRLSDEAYRVTQEGATEAPYTGKYYHYKEDGMYHCIVCDEKLFDSDTKFDSQSGWPSFYDAANNQALKLKEDNSHGMRRTEVVCAKCGGHLGHLFQDAPETPTGARYCINACALDFKSKDVTKKDAN